MIPSPAERYESDLNAGLIIPDAAQRLAVIELQHLYERVQARAARKKGLLGRLFGASAQKPEIGLYLWGGARQDVPHGFVLRGVDLQAKGAHAL
jgi:cell division protein ZapE